MNPYRYVPLGDEVYVDQWGPPPPNRVKLLGAAIGVMLLVVVVHSCYQVIITAKDNAARTSCQSNFEQIGLCFMQYTQDYDQHFPLVSVNNYAGYSEELTIGGHSKNWTPSQIYGWADALQPYARTLTIYQCPAEGHGPVTNPMERNYTDYCYPGSGGWRHVYAPMERNYTDYWYNRRLSGLAQRKINSPAQTILAGDGNDGTDQTDARYSLAALPADWLTDESKPSFRHLGGANYLFTDGHCKWLKPDGISVNPVVANNYNSITFAITQLPVKREH